MLYVPFLGRLDFRDYVALVLGYAFLAFESVVHIVVLCLPKPVINWLYQRSRGLFLYLSGGVREKSEEKKFTEQILKARDFGELCNINGYVHEEHVVLTKDGYLLGLHRLPSKKGQKKSSPGTSTGKPVVYLHHGLLMNSEIWVCLTDAQRCLPFVLVEQGFDVWFGNNRYACITSSIFTVRRLDRGNKYSKKSIHHGPNTNKFWDYRYVTLSHFFGQRLIMNQHRRFCMARHS